MHFQILYDLQIKHNYPLNTHCQTHGPKFMINLLVMLNGVKRSLYIHFQSWLMSITIFYFKLRLSGLRYLGTVKENLCKTSKNLSLTESRKLPCSEQVLFFFFSEHYKNCFVQRQHLESSLHLRQYSLNVNDISHQSPPSTPHMEGFHRRGHFS